MRKINQKGNTALYILIVIVLFVLIGGGIYFFTIKNSQQSPQKTLATNQNAQSNPQASSNLLGVPVYPGSMLLSKNGDSVCLPGSTTDCVSATNAYSLKGISKTDVINWYLNTKVGADIKVTKNGDCTSASNCSVSFSKTINTTLVTLEVDVSESASNTSNLNIIYVNLISSLVAPSSVPIVFLDTTSWKTYSNSKYGFSFKYPREWNLKITSSELAELDADCSHCTDIPLPWVPVQITVLDNANNVSLHDIAQQKHLYEEWTDHSIGISETEMQSRINTFNSMSGDQGSLKPILDSSLPVSSAWDVGLMGACSGSGMFFVSYKTKIIELRFSCANQSTDIEHSFKFTQ